MNVTTAAASIHPRFFCRWKKLIEAEGISSIFVCLSFLMCLMYYKRMLSMMAHLESVKCFGTLKQFWKGMKPLQNFLFHLGNLSKFSRVVFVALSNWTIYWPSIQRVVNSFLNRNSYVYGSSSSLIKCLWVGEGKGHLVTLTTLRGSYHPHQRRNCCWNGCQLFEKLESNWMRKANLHKNLSKKQAERIPVKVICGIFDTMIQAAGGSSLPKYGGFETSRPQPDPLKNVSENAIIF